MLSKIARAGLVALLSALLVGFGVCGAYGTVVGLSGYLARPSEGRAFAPIFVVCGIIGLIIAWVCWRAIARTRRAPPPPEE